MAATRRPWKKWAAYGAFALVAFVFALRQTFPAQAVGERLVLEAAALGWQLDFADIRPAGIAGVRLTGVTLQTADGARIPVDDARAGARLLPLLLGRRGVDFDARLLGGSVTGRLEEGGATRRIAAHVEGIDLGRAAGIRKLSGLDLAGTLRGDVDLALDLREAAKSSGRIDLGVEKGAIQGGEVPVAAMGGGALTLPRIGLGTVTAKAEVKDGKATFGTLEAKGDDVELQGDGLYFVVQPRLAQAPLFGRATVRVQDGFWQKSGSGGMKGLVEVALAPARRPDGAYQFQVFGTLAQPQARPAPGP
jgi:type II secretion system protein N